MEIKDRVYGFEQIDEPVLLELLQSAAVKRLGGVLQHGISGLIGLTRPVTRLEHSLGVMVLVRRLGGGVKEQIAALLHDVSHTAFSHVIDYVVQNHDGQSYHEEMKEQFMAGSDLPAGLAGYGYDWRDFLHEEHYPLLEQPAPRLCADRLDYFLRDSLDLGLISPAGITQALAHLVVHEGRIMADDLAVARWLAYSYIAADEASWANFREVGLYEVTAKAIQRGLAIGAIAESDFWGDDQGLWGRLQAGSDPLLKQLFAQISVDSRFVWDEQQPDFWVGTKLRTIDPDVVDGSGRSQPLSALDPHFAAYRQDYLHRKQGKWPMRLIGPYDKLRK